MNPNDPVGEWCAYLRSRGWRPYRKHPSAKETVSIWVSPTGGLYRGPYGAYIGQAHGPGSSLEPGDTEDGGMKSYCVKRCRKNGDEILIARGLDSIEEAAMLALKLTHYRAIELGGEDEFIAEVEW